MKMRYREKVNKESSLISGVKNTNFVKFREQVKRCTAKTVGRYFACLKLHNQFSMFE